MGTVLQAGRLAETVWLRKIATKMQTASEIDFIAGMAYGFGILLLNIFCSFSLI